MMADLKNLALTGGGGSRYSGDEQVQFIPGGSHQVTIKSPPPSLHLENLNNAVLRYDAQSLIVGLKLPRKAYLRFRG